MCASVRVHTYMCVLRTYITSFALIGARMYMCPCVGSSSVDASDKRQCSNPGTHVRRSVRVCGTQHFESTPVMKDVQTFTYLCTVHMNMFIYVLVHMYIVVQCRMYLTINVVCVMYKCTTYVCMYDFIIVFMYAYLVFMYIHTCGNRAGVNMQWSPH